MLGGLVVVMGDEVEGAVGFWAGDFYDDYLGVDLGSGHGNRFVVFVVLVFILNGFNRVVFQIYGFREFDGLHDGLASRRPQTDANGPREEQCDEPNEDKRQHRTARL
jgi:hypothetical protein